MTATTKSPGARPDCVAVLGDFVFRMRGLQLESLRSALLMLEFRLGTKAEIPCDAERAQLLSREIKDRLAAQSQARLPSASTTP